MVGEADCAALTRAVDAVFAEKAAMSSVTAAVLSRTLTAGTTRHNDRLTGLLDQLAAAGQELVEARQAAVWAACSPDITANATPNYALLALGLRQPVERTLGVVTQLHAERVVTPLRADADVLKTAATAKQRARMEGRGRDERAGAAVWADTDEGRQQTREERQAALQRHIEMWGAPPA